MYPKKSMTQARAAKPRTSAAAAPAAPAAPAKKSPKPQAAAPAAAGGRRIQVRRSGVHGKGVFAIAPIARGDTIIEYKGEIISWDEALRRHPHDPTDPNHTFYFQLDSGEAIDAAHGGNAARWINHACNPNCEADETMGRVFIKALRALKPGEELFYDYGLSIDAPYTRKVKKEYECRCGAKNCRGTMLAPKR
jgi:SET domain-containing protein